jgi:hypothetical protein
MHMINAYMFICYTYIHSIYFPVICNKKYHFEFQITKDHVHQPIDVPFLLFLNDKTY